MMLVGSMGLMILHLNICICISHGCINVFLSIYWPTSSSSHLSSSLPSHTSVPTSHTSPTQLNFDLTIAILICICSCLYFNYLLSHEPLQVIQFKRFSWNWSHLWCYNSIFCVCSALWFHLNLCLFPISARMSIACHTDLCQKQHFHKMIEKCWRFASFISVIV